MKFYISDTHLGHKNIIKHCNRPFKTVEEMDETIINNWNKVVKKDDEVYILGDFSYRNSTSGANYLKRLNGKKFLIIGNHDNVTPEMRALFEWVGVYKEVHDNGHKIVLFHYPIVEWDGYFRDSYHFYGHIHNNFENDAHKIMKDIPHAYNVGADILGFTPRTFDEIVGG